MGCSLFEVFWCFLIIRFESCALARTSWRQRCIFSGASPLWHRDHLISSVMLTLIKVVSGNVLLGFSIVWVLVFLLLLTYKYGIMDFYFSEFIPHSYPYIFCSNYPKFSIWDPLSLGPM